MRFYQSALLLIAVVFTVSIAVGWTEDATHLLALSLPENHSGVSTVRMLRTDRKQDVEERTGNGNVPIGSKIIKWMISSKSAKLQLSLVEKYKVRSWVKNKKNPNYVFNRLKLGGGVDKILTNPKLKLYVSYVDLFNKQNPTKKVTMVDMFTKTYSDEAVAKMIEIGLSSPRTKTLAARFGNDLLDSWKTQGKTAENIFRLLKIDTAGYNLFRSPKMSKDSNPTLNIFAAYIHQLNKQNSRHKVQMIDVFRKNYDDNAIAKMVEMGVTVPRTSKVTSVLKKQLLAKWEGSTESVDGVFKILKLDKAGDSLFASPELKTLYSYTTKMHPRNPKKVLLQVLTDHYGYDGLSKIFVMGPRRMDLAFLAKDFENAMLAQWLTKKVSPNEVFKLLKLNHDIDTLLTNPNFVRTWAIYKIMFNSRNDARATTMETLRKFYSYEKLSNMLDAAEKVPATKIIAIKLLNELKNTT